MGDYVNRQRQGYDAEQVLIASATKTASETGSGIHVGENVELDVEVNVRGTVSGTSPTLDVVIEESDDNITFTTLHTFAQITAAGLAKALMRTTKQYVRADLTIGGTTPSFGGLEVFAKS